MTKDDILRMAREWERALGKERAHGIGGEEA